MSMTTKQIIDLLALIRSSHGVILTSNPPKDAWLYHGVDQKISEALRALECEAAESVDRSSPSAWMADRIDLEGFDQEVPAVTWRSPEEQRFFHQQMGHDLDRFRMCMIPLYRDSCETLLDTTPGSTLKVMRGPGGGLYLSGVEDLREGDVFRREVRG